MRIIGAAAVRQAGEWEQQPPTLSPERQQTFHAGLDRRREDQQGPALRRRRLAAGLRDGNVVPALLKISNLNRNVVPLLSSWQQQRDDVAAVHGALAATMSLSCC
jgi:hypothetical protein